MQYLYQVLIWGCIIYLVGVPLRYWYIGYKEESLRDRWLNGELTIGEYERLVGYKVVLDLVRVDEIKLVTGDGKVYVSRWKEGEYYLSVDGYMVHENRVVMTG